MIIVPYPIFHPGEEARIGREAYDRRMIGRACTVEAVLSAIGGEYRYAVSTESGLCTTVLESTLQKVFGRGNWRDCAWQPRKEKR